MANNLTKSRNKIKITFLGTGSNGGIPQVDCRCRLCSSNNHADFRMRSSILIECQKTKIIIDCGPDFRRQILNQNIRINEMSGIVISHLHWDHSIGLVELGAGKPLSIPILAPTEIINSLLRSPTFKFLFKKNFARENDSPKLPFKIKFIKIPHGKCKNTFAVKVIFKNKSILIATDISKINRNFIQACKKCSLIIFDGTFLENDAFGHICIKNSTKILSKQNKRVIFTHINHSENIKKIESFLTKNNFSTAKDGEKIVL